MSDPIDTSLLDHRFAPVVERVRGRDLATKRRVVARLGPDEAAVFVWYSFHVHAGTGDGSSSDVDLFRRLCELYIVEWGVWDEIEGAALRSEVPQFGVFCRRARTLVHGDERAIPDDAWRDLSNLYHQVAPAVTRRFIDAAT